MSGSGFCDRQRSFFREADGAHFAWQTENPYFARTERALIAELAAPGEGLFLEVGSGEGGNLANLFGLGGTTPGPTVGVDLFERKLAFARAAGVPGRFVCADAAALPFRDGSAAVVLCRDLLHHLEEPDRALAELRRVTRPGGQWWVVEPNGRNPLMGLLALARPHERGQLRNSRGRLRALVGRHFGDVAVEVRQPFPVFRLLLHHRFGLPRLGSSRMFAILMDAWDRVWRRLWPRALWAYVVVRATGPTRSDPTS